jgi:RHS repeat-associated protein
VGGSSYIDDAVCFNQDDNSGWASQADGTLEHRRVLGESWRHDTAAVLSDTGKVVETVKYLSYGAAFGMPAGDVDSNGTWDSTDSAAITGSYDPRKDTDQDGSVGAADITWANSITGSYQTLGWAVLTSSAVTNTTGYAAYRFDPAFAGAPSKRSLMHVRNRVYDADTGRWLRRDPAGYVESCSLYEYAISSPPSGVDPLGLGCNTQCDPCHQCDPCLTPIIPILVDSNVASCTTCERRTVSADLAGIITNVTDTIVEHFTVHIGKWCCPCP